MLEENTFDTGEVTINYVEGPPSGRPLLLLHGGGDRWQHFLPILPILTERWHVYALDLRGHGKSGRVPGQYRPEQIASDIIAFLDNKVTELVILFGHSLGGWVALLVAAARLDRIHALILGDPPLNIERFLAYESSEERLAMWRTLKGLMHSSRSVEELATSLANLPASVSTDGEVIRYEDLPGMDIVHIRGWAKTLSQADPDVILYHAGRRLEEYVANLDMDNTLMQLSCPVLLLQGDPAHGGVVSDEDTKHTMALLPNGFHVKLEGKSHDLGLGDWQVDKLLCGLTNFLESI